MRARTTWRGPGQRVRAVGVTEAGRQVGAHLLELQRGAGRQGLLRVDHGSQRVVVDDDQLGGVDRRGMGLGHHSDDGVADEADLVHGQRGPAAARVEDHEPVHERELEVGGRVHGEHPGGLGGLRDVDAADTGVGDRRADEHHVSEPRHGDVADVAASSEEELGILDPADSVSENGAWHVRNVLAMGLRLSGGAGSAAGPAQRTRLNPVGRPSHEIDWVCTLVPDVLADTTRPLPMYITTWPGGYP